ncbi:MAG: low molecular weight protein arginine phosphatase [Acutalibacteraceae bacterium]
MNILFVCTGNTCRSPMAEAIARLRTAEREDIAVRSAGLFVNDIDGVSAHALEAIAEIGGDLSQHLPTQLTPEIMQWADVIVPMTASHKAALIAAGADEAKIRMLPSDVPDPFMQSADVYRQCRDQLCEYIDILIGSLNEHDNS